MKKNYRDKIGVLNICTNTGTLKKNLSAEKTMNKISQLCQINGNSQER